MAIGNDAKALEINLQAIQIAEKNNLFLEKASLSSLLGRIYKQSHNYEKALSLNRQSMKTFDSLHDYHMSAMVRSDIGEIYSFVLSNMALTKLIKLRPILIGTWHKLS